jgi:hypothetical protein
VINLKTAKATPLAVLARADEEMPAIGVKANVRRAAYLLSRKTCGSAGGSGARLVSIIASSATVVGKQ